MNFLDQLISLANYGTFGQSDNYFIWNGNWISSYNLRTVRKNAITVKKNFILIELYLRLTGPNQIIYLTESQGSWFGNVFSYLK